MEQNSRFVLGTAQFGLNYGINNLRGQIPKEECFLILDECKKNSILTLDTAQGYGNSHEIISEFLQKSDNPFQVMTKFKLEKELGTLAQIEKIFSELKINKIHCLYFHDSNSFEELKDWSVLEQLKETGQIEKIGVSVYSNLQAQTAIDNEHVDLIQMPMNLLDNYARRFEIIKYAKKMNKQIFIRSIFLQGLFFKEEKDFAKNLKLKSLLKPIQDLQYFCKTNEMSMHELCLSYAMSFQDIDGILIGVDDMDQLKRNLEYINKGKILSAAQIQKIHNIQVLDEDMLLPTQW